MVNFIPAEEIEAAAEQFLHSHHPDFSIPIPIDDILEIRLGIEVVPIKGLLSEHSIDGFLSRDLKTISIDFDRYMSTTGNYRGRFTLAHEAGHLAMHSDYINSLEYSDVEGWKSVIYDRSKKHDRLEIQAGMFAKYLLMPSVHVKQIFEEEKEMLRSNLAGNPMPSDLDLAPYAAKKLGRCCQVSAEAAALRLTEWVKSGS